jgi:hypothetical protein
MSRRAPQGRVLRNTWASTTMKDRIRLWAIERPVKSISVKEAAKKKRNERSKSHLKTSQNFVLTFQSTL